MNAVFDILLLLGAIIAIWKLRSVFGQRTGFEKKESLADSKNATLETKSNEPIHPTTSFNYVEENVSKTLDSNVNKILDSFTQKDKNFLIREFIQGAQIAYKIIVEAFAKGDIDALKKLVRQNVAERFQAEFKKRSNKNHVTNAIVRKITLARIINADLKKIDEQEEAQITVEMKSEQIAWTEDAEGRIISGDPNIPREMKDVWTFERNLQAENPNWFLVATGA